MNHDIERVLFSQEELHQIVSELGARITEDYRGKDLVLVCILRGSFVFAADLARCIDLPCSIDFMVVSSYGAGSVSTGNVKIIKDLSDSIAGKDVLVIEDILDSGNTLSHLLEILKVRHASSIKLCTLLDKPSRRIQNIHADYPGRTIDDLFVVGYGLDYAEKYRNLPYIGVLKPEVYEGK